METNFVIISFLGWCTVINFGILLFASISLVLFGDYAKKIHARMFKIDERDLDIIYFKYLAYYKIAILIFNLTPYIAFKIVTS